MSNTKKLLKKYQLKKIAYHAFYSDECDNLNAFHKKDLLNETGSIFDMIIYDLKDLINRKKLKSNENNNN